MPFSLFEESRESSCPAELYEFSYQNRTLRYTTADRDISYGSNLYTSVQMARSKIDESGEITKASLTLTAPPDFLVADLFSVAPPDDVVGLVIRRLQYVDGTAEVVWVGRVLGAGWPKDQCELRCESVFTQMKALGLRRIYGRNCPHILYGAACRAAEADFRETIVIASQAGRTLTSATFDTFTDGYFAGGKIVWESSPGFFVSRGIKSHIGDEVEVTHPLPGLIPGTSVTALPGCDHTFPTCGSKFGNTPNYGGFPYMQNRNPFGSTSVF